MKRCKPGMIWAWWRRSADSPVVCFGKEEPDTGGLVGDGESYVFKHEHGVEPPKGKADKAILIDTTRREWWCPTCKKWVSDQRIYWVLDEDPDSPTYTDYIPLHVGFCVYAPIRKSRCIVVDTISLK